MSLTNRPPADMVYSFDSSPLVNICPREIVSLARYVVREGANNVDKQLKIILGRKDSADRLKIWEVGLSSSGLRYYPTATQNQDGFVPPIIGPLLLSLALQVDFLSPEKQTCAIGEYVGMYAHAIGDNIQLEPRDILQSYLYNPEFQLPVQPLAEAHTHSSGIDNWLRKYNLALWMRAISSSPRQHIQEERECEANTVRRAGRSLSTSRTLLTPEVVSATPRQDDQSSLAHEDLQYKTSLNGQRPLINERHYSDVVDFRDFIESAQISVVDLRSSSNTQESRPFVPIDALKRYLSEDVVRKLLSFYNIPTTLWQGIHRYYSVVFAVLIFIGKGENIERFQHYARLADVRLPFGQNDRFDWPLESQHFFQDFYEAQWKFCAVTLKKYSLNDTRFQSELILPITSRQVLKEGPDSRTYRIEIHPSYNFLVENTKTTPAPKSFVLKTCRAKNNQLHHNEVEAYRLLEFNEDLSRNTVQFYGSWVQRQEYNVLLEYVDGGTLEDFFFSTAPPAHEEDIILFWERLVDVVKLLARIHRHPDPNNLFRFLQGIHNDIKPTNILVTKPKSQSDFDLTFKLADMGLCHFAPVQKKGEGRTKDTGGTQIFAPPECSRDENNHFLRHSIIEAKPSKDIWSMGCVLSETLVWSVGGTEYLQQYRSQREMATNRIPQLRNSAYTGCFHDSKRVLRIVQDMHVRARTTRRRGDNVVSEMINVVENMLDDAPNRPEAGDVYKAFQKIIARARSMMGSTSESSQNELGPAILQTLKLPPELPPDYDHYRFQSQSDPHNLTSSASSRCPPGFRPSLRGKALLESATQDLSNSALSSVENDTVPTPPSSKPKALKLSIEEDKPRAVDTHRTEKQSELVAVSIKEVNQWIARRKENAVTPSLYGNEDLRALNYRNQIFVFDNSTSMQRHWPDVKNTFAALAYLVKGKNPDGIELHLTSNPTNSARSKNRGPLLSKLNRNGFGGQCDIGLTLGKILRDISPESSTNLFSRLGIRQNTKYGVNIYVLTDGVWQDGHDWLDAIVEPIKNLISQGMNQNRLGIQFIQFGRNPEGTKRLKVLDDELRDQGIPVDFIDTEHWSGNVYKMLLGAIDPRWGPVRSPKSPMRTVSPPRQRTSNSHSLDE